MICPSHDSISTDLVTFTFSGPAKHTERPLFIDAENPSRALNAAQFKFLVRSLIAGLQSHGVQRGDCVLVHSKNNVIYPALFLAIVGAGGVHMGSNPNSRSFELEHTLDLAEPRIIITCAESLETVLAVSSGKGINPEQIFLLDDSAISNVIRFVNSPEETSPVPSTNSEEQYMNFMDLLSQGQNDWRILDDEKTSKETPAAMFPTSGTTGLSKAAIMSHHSLISWHMSVCYEVPYEVTRLIAIPMFHNFSSTFTHFFSVRYGHPLYILPEFNLSQVLKAASKYQISEMYLVPVMIQMISQSSLPVKESLSSVRYVGVAGAPIDGESMQKFQDLLHADARASQMWGMTEVGVAMQNRYSLSDKSYEMGSIGKLSPGYETRLIDAENGRIILDDNCPGQLYIRGPGLLLTYKGRSNAKDDDGWFDTGDVAYTKEGYYFIFGRTKEIIKVRGYQVAPAEIEAVLLTHPQIRDAGVIGVTSADESTEVPCAYIVPKSPTTKPTAQDVYEFAGQRLAGYKSLDGGVIMVDQIPRSTIGKIQRFKLSHMHSQRERMAKLLARGK